MHKLVTLAIFLFVSSALGAHNLAEIFNGAYTFVNSSQLVNGTRVPVAVGRIGSIMYAPAYPGALYGNMSVVYGVPLDSSVDCMRALTAHSAYTGPYQVFPSEGHVTHYPIVTSNPISGHTPRGLPAVRYFETYENDNLITVESRPDTTIIFWRRSIPFPEGPACTLTAQVTPTESAWVANGKTNQKYTLSVKNTGASIITSANVEINLPLSASITSSWNLVHISGNTYSVSLPSGLGAGQTNSFAGFIVAGAGSITVGVPPSATICN